MSLYPMSLNSLHCWRWAISTLNSVGGVASDQTMCPWPNLKILLLVIWIFKMSTVLITRNHSTMNKWRQPWWFIQKKKYLWILRSMLQLTHPTVKRQTVKWRKFRRGYPLIWLMISNLHGLTFATTYLFI